MKTIDRTIYDLCDEIDVLKDEVKYYKELYELERDLNIKVSKERLADAKKGVANALMFALSVRDDENGNLVIPSKERKRLAKNLKP